jgi:trimeric autotransporter adhesin
MGFNYQAIARNANGVPIASQSVPVRISIVTALTGGTVMWQEEFSSVTTDAYGLISLVVGNGTHTGGSATSFSSIDWNAQTLFLKTEVKYPGTATTWTNMGTSQIWSVPYSLVAKNIAPLSKLGITGTTDDMEDALFEVKNKTGQTVFAVYNEGIRAYVGNGDAKGKRGGFAVGGYDATKGSTIYDLLTLNTDSARLYFDSNPTLKGARGGFSVGGYDMTKTGVPIHDYLDVSKDSVRIYVDSDPTSKGKKGGFSVGGYDMTKGELPAQDYMHISKDSVRVYVDSNPATKGKRGGFAVGGYDLTKGGVTIDKFLAVNPDSTRIFTTDANKGFGVGSLSTGVAQSYLKLTPENYFIGHEAGKSNTTGLYNSFLGYEAGISNTIGNSNILMGYKSGLSNTTGSYNIFLGDSSGVSNTDGQINLFMGYKAGAGNTTGSMNIFLGDSSGVSNTIGGGNVFIGDWAGYKSSTGWDNIIIGIAGYENTTGSENVIMGTFAGTYNHDGSHNVYIGEKAGFSTSGGMNNVFIGSNAGHRANSSNLTGSVLIGANAGYNSSGWHNVFLGAGSGTANKLGNDNVFIGFEAGRYDTLSSKLYIANSSTAFPLIYGEFDKGTVIINGNSNNNTFDRTLFVNGAAGGNYAWYNDSDRKLKHDIVTIPDALDKVLKLRGVNFLWNQPTEGMDGLQIGFIGQEVADIVPEVVSVKNDHYSMQYAPVTALLVEAIKEQQKQIDNQKKEIDELKTLVNSLIANQTAQVNK